MIQYRDLRALAAWCQARGIRFLPARAEGDREALLLERHGRRHCGSMLLVRDRHGFCLIDPMGELLATASDLPSLLDALDGGVAEPDGRSDQNWPMPALAAHRGAPVAA